MENERKSLIALIVTVLLLRSNTHFFLFSPRLYRVGDLGRLNAGQINTTDRHGPQKVTR